MDWGLFWTIVVQVLLAELILGIPTAVTMLLLGYSWSWHPDQG